MTPAELLQSAPPTLPALSFPQTPPPAPATAEFLHEVQPTAMGDLRLLVERVTNGFNAGELQFATNLGWDRYLEYQLAYEDIDDSLVDNVLSVLTTLDLSAEQLYLTYLDDAATPVFELIVNAILRHAYSQKQLYERMVEFWTDHFNIYQLDDLAIWWKTVDDREVIRAHAMGKFPDMLRASARSAAMLWYLDNYANVAGAPQENYSRELMELHTLGVDGPYTEQDVVEVARCFTGWSFYGAFIPGPLGEFVFDLSRHDLGQKTVLGHVIPAAGGIQDGEQVLDILAMHPSTARFISRKMAKWLLVYEPSEELVDRVARVYMNTGGDIKSMIRQILQPVNLMTVPPGQRPKLRRPWHMLSTLMRATNAPGSSFYSLINELFVLGQVPYWWGPPNGYPDSAGAWGNNLLPRWDLASRFFDGQIPGHAPDPAYLDALLLGYPPGERAQAMNMVLTGGRMSPSDVARVQDYIDGAPSFTEAVMLEAFGMAATSPSFQYY